MLVHVAAPALDGAPPPNVEIDAPEVPPLRPAEARRHQVRVLRAPDLDRCLRHLARHEARCRLVPGRLARR